nr:RNA-directed DNA polymerase, eukaryota, reverse transcriptase zinc-binding domain protein [Tanacetum cinerariifolium]
MSSLRWCQELKTKTIIVERKNEWFYFVQYMRMKKIGRHRGRIGDILNTVYKRLSKGGGRIGFGLMMIKSKEDYLSKISTSIFVTNFPETFTAKDLFHTCKVYGHVVDSFIPSKRSREGKRFGLVRGPLNGSPNSGKPAPVKKNGGNNENGPFASRKGGDFTENGKSFANVLSGKSISVSVESESTPATVLDDDCLHSKDLSKSLIELWVLLEFANVKSKDAFSVNIGVGSWFSKIRQTSMDFTPEGRIVWIEAEGIPFKVWSMNAFKRIAAKWGDLVDVNDEDDSCFHSKKLCVYTKIHSNIFENIKVVYRGKIVGTGRVGFARVLVEVEAEKGLPDTIEIEYRDCEKVVTGKKYVKVEYDWKLALCSFCKVFGNNDKKCSTRPKTDEELEELKKNEAQKSLGKLAKQNAVKNLKNKEKLSVCAVLETRLKGQSVNKIGEKVFKGWNKFDNAHFIKTREKLFCSFIYAENSGKLRRKLWVDLVAYKAICNNCPWVLMGDLNVSLNIEDHSEGISYKIQDMEEFQDCVNSIKMADLSSTGLHYTWTKSLMNHNASVLKKIDRVMGSGDFMEVYSRAHAVFLPYGISDHSPVILTCSNDVRKNTKSFQFANYIADKMEFGNLVMIDEDPHNRPLKVMGVDALKEYSVALDDEEKLLFQRAKVNWLNDGDMNSDFFHKVIKGRINRSIVGEIWSEDNVRYSGDQIPSQFVNHFKNFLGVQSSKECLELYNDLFSNKISEQEAISMIEEVTNEEVKAAMFNIDDNKAPGPDGFTAKFYKKDWHVVGNDVCEAVKEFFTKGKLLGELNATIITRVPKVSTPMICSWSVWYAEAIGFD